MNELCAKFSSTDGKSDQIQTNDFFLSLFVLSKEGFHLDFFK